MCIVPVLTDTADDNGHLLTLTDMGKGVEGRTERERQGRWDKYGCYCAASYFPLMSETTRSMAVHLITMEGVCPRKQHALLLASYCNITVAHTTIQHHCGSHDDTTLWLTRRYNIAVTHTTIHHCDSHDDTTSL
ncbi:hypothetical protein BaRGS_00013584 [Batillaria attramentaria]|uniref:Uncharacterized protein n=1 Tax=Batillaria attramentaria TaxID=370345 RepID=A0ABD0L7U0_9CAEN